MIKLKEPVIYALPLFAFNRSGGTVMLPKETDSAFDPRTDMIGTNAFMLTNYTPSVSFTLKRHPDHYDQDHALVDQVNFPIIPEYAAALSQFKAGNIYTMGSRSPGVGVRQEEILSVKREEPRLQIMPSDLIGSGSITVFSFLPGSPFHDERVRQAVSMSWDRDLYIDTLNNVSKFRAEGIDVEVRWNSALTASNEGWWLDPQAKDFGSNGKYYRHDIGEAKKLLVAAGYPSGLRNITSSYVTGPQLPTSRQAEILDGMAAEAGIISKAQSVDYATEYIQKYRDARGRHEGWAYITALSGGSGDPIEQLATEYWSKAGITFHGFDAAGKGDGAGDPQVDALIEKARVERDTQKRKALVFDLQRYLAKPLYTLKPPGLSSGFEMIWPCLANFRVHQRPTPYLYGRWIDETKPPFTKA